MATASTRPLSATRLSDRLSISVDPSVSAGKNGYWKVVLSSITWTGSSLSTTDKVTLDVRAPLFNSQNDTPIIDNAVLNSSAAAASFTNTTQVLAVIAGNPGPSAFVQGDDTWDILHIKTSLGAATEVTNLVLTVTYTATFVEITSFSGLTAASIGVNVSDDVPSNTVSMTVTPNTGSGVYVFLPVGLDTLLDDMGDGGDSVPNFAVSTIATPGSFALSQNIVTHPISKSSTHSKAYPTNTVWNFAVNYGKVDANGTAIVMNKDTTTSTVHLLSAASLSRVDEWPSDDVVTATFSYKYGFVTA